MKSVAGVVRANGSSEDPEGYAEKLLVASFLIFFPTGLAQQRLSVLWNGMAGP
jgi:hypothetical protein